MNKILLVGATGYVGGTVLSRVLHNDSPSLKSLQIHLLVRSEDHARKLHEAYGERVYALLWTGLDDTAFIEATAAQYDIIINTGSGFIPAGATAFVDGLARRIGTGDPIPWLIHTAGCTNLVDPTKRSQEWNDEKDGRAIYDYEAELEEENPYPQRTAELAVLEKSSSSGVNAISMQVPCIFGEGLGLFNKQGLVVPMIVKYVVEHGYGFKLNDRANFDWVHVEDLADYYVLLVETILARTDRGMGYIPTGKEGILFPTVGRALVSEMNAMALEVSFAAKVLPREGTSQQKEVRLAPLQEIADELTGGFSEIAERGWGGEKAVRGTIGRKLLGWKPKKLEGDWRKDFEDELFAYMEGRRGITINSCVAAP